VRETTLQTPRSAKKEGEGGAQNVRAESLPLQLVLKTMVRHVVPLQPMEVHGGADHRITESQNHRMVGVGIDLCRSPSPTPLPEQGHLQQAAQDRV